jgi:hypothetical protein
LGIQSVSRRGGGSAPKVDDKFEMKLSLIHASPVRQDYSIGKEGAILALFLRC